MLTMNYQDLTARIREHRADSTTPTAGAAAVLGSRATGELLDPGTVRRIACDAGIIPAVLGSRGEILDQGRLQRVFTLGQIRALWRRDRHCTFPDCDIPAAWCDAHHLVHWIDGGPTDLSNAALLCPRHHTIVHRDQLAGHVCAAAQERTAASHPPGRRTLPRTAAAWVTWDLRPGSYHARCAGGVGERLTA
jgi:hypothetical protein